MQWWLQTLFDHHLFLPTTVAVAAAVVVVVAIHPLPLFIADPDCSLLLLPQSMECPIPHSAHQVLHDLAHGI